MTSGTLTPLDDSEPRAFDLLSVKALLEEVAALAHGSRATPLRAHHGRWEWHRLAMYGVPLAEVDTLSEVAAELRRASTSTPRRPLARSSARPAEQVGRCVLAEQGRLEKVSAVSLPAEQTAV